MYRLSVVIPAYNEAHRLGATLEECISYLASRDYDSEIIVADDGSTDATAAIAASYRRARPALRVVSLPRNRGKGAALRQGCLSAGGEYVLFMDADHSTHVRHVEMFLPLCAKGYDVVAGVRTFQEGESRMRRIVGLGFLMFAHLFVFRKAVVDSQCGFKCFTRRAAQRLFALCRTDGGTIDVEIFYLAHKLGLRVHFVPVEWRNPPGSTIRVWRCILADPLDMLKVRLRDVWGQYDR